MTLFLSLSASQCAPLAHSFFLILTPFFLTVPREPSLPSCMYTHICTQTAQGFHRTFTGHLSPHHFDFEALSSAIHLALRPLFQFEQVGASQVAPPPFFFLFCFADYPLGLKIRVSFSPSSVCLCTPSQHSSPEHGTHAPADSAQKPKQPRRCRVSTDTTACICIARIVRARTS